MLRALLVIVASLYALRALRTLAVTLLCVTVPFEAHALCFIGCRPSEEDARVVFEYMLHEKIGSDPYAISSFKKTTASTHHIINHTFYLIAYTAELTFPIGVHATCSANGTREPSPTHCEWRVFVAARNDPPNYVGATLTLDGAVVFERMPRGWRAINGTFYAQPLSIMPLRPRRLVHTLVHLILWRGTIVGTLAMLFR